jgi:membrane protease YdiL (CAAX protease family)
MNPYYAYMFGTGLPMGILLVAALVTYQAQGNPWRWNDFKHRFRYETMNLKDWLWLAGIFIVEIFVYSLLTRLSSALIQQGIIPVPAWLPEFLNPKTVFTTATLDTAVGGLYNNWIVLFISTVMLFVNILGEEFWWRGIVLPRQELSFGRWTWIIHGLMWTAFHLFKWWDLLNLIPLSLGLSWVVFSRRKNTPGLVMHLMTNGVGLLPILLGVLGRA